MRALILLGILTMFFSCEKDGGSDGTKLDLVFELRYDGEPLSGSQEFYQLNDSIKMRFSKVSFYLSDFKLKGDAETLPLVDIVHISFLQNINGDAVQEMQQALRFEVPEGDYESLAFGLGLTASQNATTPAIHEAGSALSLTSEYWTAWESYIFEKIEGAYQVNNEPSESVALHIGSDPTYHVMEWNDGFSLSSGESKQLTIPIDLYYILKDYPISEAPVLHKLEQLPYMELIADSFSASMNN